MTSLIAHLISISRLASDPTVRDRARFLRVVLPLRPEQARVVEQIWYGRS